MHPSAPDLSPLKSARRNKLLDVALHLFTAQGFRATTMEGLAEAAGLSKVTVYGYFSDKDAVFEAVAVRLAERLRVAVMGQLQTDAPVVDRVINALTVKHVMIHDLVRSSAFAVELMAQKAVVNRIFSDLDTALIAQIGDALADHQAARILFNGAMGIANAAASRSEMETDIARLVGGFLG
ncbi:TetR/AcrR family transcriptional regulator [Tabrizicola sp.]|uniref:TetR/AcrR family transcriptional regulator n=1 Tax=Tabrizicola sp. TaxID=2005166 RepID=UPI003F2DA23F